MKELTMPHMTTTAPLNPVAPANCTVEHYFPENGVCTKEIAFVVDDGNIEYVNFIGGCEGNLKAIASMIDGMHVDFIRDRFKGITCGSKSTSCVDQLCHAIDEYLNREQQK